MSDQKVKSSGALSGVQSSLDSPRSNESVYDAAISISGWVYAPERDPASCRVRAYLDGFVVAETRAFSVRPDVCKALRLSPQVATGFRMLAYAPPLSTEARDVTLRVTALWEETGEIEIAARVVRLIPSSLREKPYGEVVHPENATLLHRENIYGSGPPIEAPGPETLSLLRAYLPPQCSVVDIGCGAGAYGPPLIAAGHDWLGLETNSHCCEILQRRQLPFRRVDSEGSELPCGDREWDAAICIEVLEHVKEPDIFLREITRTSRRRALFSVPNLEVLPYFHGWAVVPWHLLEADHKNFFTRASLRSLLERYFRRVEIFSYGEHPLKTRDGVPVHVHFWAIAEI